MHLRAVKMRRKKAATVMQKRGYVIYKTIFLF